MLLSQNNEKAAMLVIQTNPLGIKFFSYVKTFLLFQEICIAAGHVSECRDTTHFDSEDDYRTGCRNVRNCQQQESPSGLRSPGRSYWTYFKGSIYYVFLNYLQSVASN